MPWYAMHDHSYRSHFGQNSFNAHLQDCTCMQHNAVHAALGEYTGTAAAINMSPGDLRM